MFGLPAPGLLGGAAVCLFYGGRIPTLVRCCRETARLKRSRLTTGTTRGDAANPAFLWLPACVTRSRAWVKRADDKAHPLCPCTMPAVGAAAGLSCGDRIPPLAVAAGGPHGCGLPGLLRTPAGAAQSSPSFSGLLLPACVTRSRAWASGLTPSSPASPPNQAFRPCTCGRGGMVGCSGS